jgi:FSR family fosmidomycin resistance protein-like MFS transporter
MDDIQRRRSAGKAGSGAYPMRRVIMASGVPSIVIYATDLVPRRIGLVGGLSYGLNFAIGGVAAADLGFRSDSIGIESVYRICSVLPAVGFVTILLPRLPARA